MTASASGEGFCLVDQLLALAARVEEVGLEDPVVHGDVVGLVDQARTARVVEVGQLGRVQLLDAFAVDEDVARPDYQALLAESAPEADQGQLHPGACGGGMLT